MKCETLLSLLRMPAAAECVRFERESFGALHQMVSGLDVQARTSAWDEIAARLREYEHNGWFAGPCEMVVGVGVN